MTRPAQSEEPRAILGITTNVASFSGVRSKGYQAWPFLRVAFFGTLLKPSFLRGARVKPLGGGERIGEKRLSWRKPGSHIKRKRSLSVQSFDHPSWFWLGEVIGSRKR